jgi:hypothetical protein
MERNPNAERGCVADQPLQRSNAKSFESSCEPRAATGFQHSRAPNEPQAVSRLIGYFHDWRWLFSDITLKITKESYARTVPEIRARPHFQKLHHRVENNSGTKQWSELRLPARGFAF